MKKAAQRIATRCLPQSAMHDKQRRKDEKSINSWHIGKFIVPLQKLHCPFGGHDAPSPSPARRPQEAILEIVFMVKETLFPDYIFETSWEVCNKVGGIYTVLSTRARTLQERIQDKLIFIGPDCWLDQPCPYFEEEAIFPEWTAVARAEGLRVRVGRWTIPSRPVAILVDWRPYFAQKDEFYGKLWQRYGVDSLHAYGDYDDSALFGLAAAKVVESFHRHYRLGGKRVVLHVNEWQTASAALVLQTLVPEVASIFTTHATCIGRSIAGNNKPLYEYLWAYNGDQMAQELNMESKHSLEKQTAHHVDCFTTVSEITARECAELLDRSVDEVLPNGFDNGFVPTGAAFTRKRKAARKRLLDIANALMGTQIGDDALIVATSGRYEFRNKGIDVFIEAMSRLRSNDSLKRQVVAFIEVPGWVVAPRGDLQARLQSGQMQDTPLETPVITHKLGDMANDNVLGMLRHLNMHNAPEDKVKLIFMPCYLTGDDGIVNLPYYDVVLGNDLCVYPSYYEPWGYTPLEAVAFHVPCVTTDLAGFGLWVNAEKGGYATIEDGVEVVHRTDYNFSEVADRIQSTVARFAAMPPKEVKACRDKADRLSKKALWSQFIHYYDTAYDTALRHAEARCGKP